MAYNHNEIEFFKIYSKFLSNYKFQLNHFFNQNFLFYFLYSYFDYALFLFFVIIMNRNICNF
jgi:hypothetical protein